MKKIYSLLAGALMLFAQSASAQTMSDENAVLQGEKYNMRLFKNYDFVQGTYNGNPFTNDAGETVSGDGCLSWSPDPTSLIVNSNQKTYQVTSPVEMSNFVGMFGSSNMINLRAACGKDGIHNYGSGGRWFALADMKIGQIVVLEHSEGTNDGKGNETTIKPNVAANNGNTGWADQATEPLQVEDITAEIHDIQDLVDADGDGEPDMTHDTHHYWKVINDGYVFIDMERNTHVKALQIWIDNAAAEAVSSPTMKMASVSGSARGIDFKPGESTLGTACQSYYITEEDKEDGIEYPLFLKKTDEIDHYDYTYNIDPETGDTLGIDSTAVYKLVLDEEEIASAGQYGEHPYNPLEGLTVTANQDIDGDGYVTIWAQTLSESGAFSSIVELSVSINEITLNAPTLSLVKVDGIHRSYKIGWTNNTLCGESYKISGTQDGSEFSFDENTGIGEIITFSESAMIKVEVEGYNEGVANVTADFAGIDVKRKNGTEGHDWDFVNISDEMYDQFMGRVAASYNETVISESGDTTIISHTPEEYKKGIEEEIEGVDEWEIVPAYYGWYQPVGNNRTTLDVVSDTIYEGEIFDKNANGYGYVKEQTGIFNGLQISCPPNKNNASCIFKYLDKADGNELGFLGVYFMDRVTITFPREVAKAGELVEIYHGKGGSNYTNTTSHEVYTVPSEELLSITLPSGGVHVFYIDVYTYEGLPEDIYETGVEATEADSNIVEIYSISGARVNALQKGINIVKMSNGKIAKMLVK